MTKEARAGLFLDFAEPGVGGGEGLIRGRDFRFALGAAFARPQPVAGQPETRTDRLRLYGHDTPLGNYSDEFTAITIP